MPIVPMTPRVNPAPLPDVRLSPVRLGGEAPAAAFGGGGSDALTGLSGGLAAIHGEAGRIAQDEKVKADQIALTDAGAQASAAMTSTLYGPDGALTKMGKNAFDAPEQARASYTAAVQQIRQGLGNDDQRVAFDRMAANNWSEIDRQVQHHLSEQRQAYDTSTTDAFVANKQNEALNGYGDPAIVGAAIGAQRSAIETYGQRNGWSDDETKQAVAKQVSNTHYTVLSRMLDNEQDTSAAQYFQTHRDEFVGAQLTQAEKLVAAGSIRASSQRWADQITSGKTPGLVAAGNIDLANRPHVANADGSVSTVRSMSFERDGKEILIPTVSDDGKLLSDDEAVAQYDRTGKHLGIFENAAAADAYAAQLHDAQAALLEGRGNGAPPAAAASLGSALAQAALISDPRVRDQTEQRIRRHFDDIAADARQARDAAWTHASAILEQTKDAGQIPLAMRMTLTPEENDALDRREDQLRHPKVQTNLSVYTHLINLSALNDATRAQFINTDISQYRGQLSDEDFKHLLGVQASARLGEDRAGNAAERRVRQREESSVVKTSDAAAKANGSVDVMRAEMQAQGKSDADIQQAVGAIQKLQPPAPRVVVPRWMLDSATADPEYANYLRAHHVPLTQATADGRTPTAANQPAATSAQSNAPAPAPQRARVPGAPLPSRQRVNPAGFGLTPQP